MDYLSKYKNLSLAIRELFYEKEFPLFLGALAVLLHFVEAQFFGLAIFVFFACVILVFIDDLTPILPLAFLVIFNFHDYEGTKNPIFYLILAPALVCFIIHAFRFKTERFKFGKFFLPLCCITLSLALGGVFSKFVSQYSQGILEIIAFGPITLLVYLYFINYLNPPKDFNIKKYLCSLIVIMAITPAIEQILMLAIKVAPDAIDKDVLGWGSVNVVATLILLAIPCEFYLLCKAKNLVPHVLVVLFLIASLFVSGSEACLGIALVITPLTIVYSILYVRKENREYYVKILLCLLLLAVIVVYICYDSGALNSLIERVKTSLSSDSGRTELYLEACDLFRQSPIFGAGMGYYDHDNPMFKGETLFYYNFHSTFFNTLAKMGMVGILSYTLLYITRYRELMKAHTPFHVFLTLAFGSYACYAMVDTAEFNIMPCVIIITLIFAMLEIINDREETYLPSFLK